MRKLILTGAALLALRQAVPLHASVLLSETFTYPDGSLVSAAGSPWVHHSGSTTGEVKIISGRVFLSQTNTEDVSAPLAGQPYPASTNALLYAGFTLNYRSLPAGAGDYFAHFKDNSSGYHPRVFATTNGVAAGFFQVGLANGGGTPTALLATNLSLNTDYRLVVRYAPSNAVGSLWLNPAAESDPGITASDTSSTMSVTSFALRESLSSGNGMGSFYLDNLAVGTSFSEVVSNLVSTVAPPTITTPPQSQVVPDGAAVTLSVVATGAPPLTFEWQLNGITVAGATTSSLNWANVTTNDAGAYVALVSNPGGTTASQTAVLTVDSTNSPPSTPALTVMTYNVKGNGATNWSTDMPQVQALGREVMYLQPDIITFNEIPYSYAWQLTNFVAAYLPGYSAAYSSTGDNYIRCGVASRYPILFSKSYLHGSSLATYGYSGSGFTRDLFQAEVAVPGFPAPLEVFVAHLKATTSSPQDDADKRAAEASAVSNFFATIFLPGTNGTHPYLLNGDMNEDVFRPETNNYLSGHPIERLTSAPTGLQLTTPLNPISHSDLTESIQSKLNVRFDYILPCGGLFSNVVSSQVFRSDLLTNPPAPLLASDDKTASDHLPVLMVFANPFSSTTLAQPFRLTAIVWQNQQVNLSWETVPGTSYRLDSSRDLQVWSILANNLRATGTSLSLSTNLGESTRFFRVRHLP